LFHVAYRNLAFENFNGSSGNHLLSHIKDSGASAPNLDKFSPDGVNLRLSRHKLRKKFAFPPVEKFAHRFSHGRCPSGTVILLIGKLDFAI